MKPTKKDQDPEIVALAAQLSDYMEKVFAPTIRLSRKEKMELGIEHVINHREKVLKRLENL